MYTVRENTRRVDSAGGLRDHGQKLGDLRYNHIALIDQPGSPFLGFGPSSPDPLTGEIINANAYVSGAGVERYAQYALDIVLPALVFTTAAIMVGFSVLALSEFTLIRNLGLVTSGLVGLCLLADVTLLPPLLLLLDRKNR